MNISIKPIKIYVQENFLYDNDTTKKNLIPAEIIGVSSYVGSPLTFHALIKDSYLYSDLPIIAFYQKCLVTEYDLKTLSFLKAPAHELENFTLYNFVDKDVCCYLVHSSVWVNGKYLTSFDFYTNNELLHLIKLDNGQLALVPNHKINWNNKSELSDYKKNHQNYNF